MRGCSTSLCSVASGAQTMPIEFGHRNLNLYLRTFCNFELQVWVRLSPHEVHMWYLNGELRNSVLYDIQGRGSYIHQAKSWAEASVYN